MKLQYINNLRAAACILVILTHSAMPATDLSFGLYMAVFSLISSPSSELFVMISASLLAPAKQEMFPFYRRRFAKLLPPFLFWSVFILIFRYAQGTIDLPLLFKKLVSIPISPAIGVYWFIYAISGLYLLIPIVSPWLKKTSKKELLFVIGIWAITLLLPYINIVGNVDFYKVNGNYYFLLVYFGGFVGYLFLGVFLRKYPIIFRSKFRAFAFILLLILVGTAPVAYGYLLDRESLSLILDNLSLTSAFYVLAIFTFFQNFKMPDFLESIFNTIATYSFGIYLIHIVVIRDLVWRLLENHRLPHPIIETPFITITSLIICFVIVRTISLLPKSKYIVGA